MKVIPEDTRQLRDFKVLAFDCFGTLVDWESGIYDELQPLRQRLPAGHPLKNDRNGLIAAFAKEETLLCGQPDPLKYSDLLAQSHRNLGTTLSLPAPPPAELTALSTSVGKWPAFPDTVAALNRLQRDFGYRLVILTNCDVTSFTATLEHTLRAVHFDAVYIAERIGSYKPNLANFRHLLENVQREFGVGQGQVLMTAHGLRSDHVPAREMGMASVWIARGVAASDGVVEEDGVRGKVGFTWRFEDMAEMADAVAREREGEGE